MPPEIYRLFSPVIVHDAIREYSSQNADADNEEQSLYKASQ